MVSDRALADVFGLRPATIALWGDVIRAVYLLALALLMAGMTFVHADTVKNTVVIRHLQDFAAFYQSAASAPAENRTPPDLNPPHFRLVILPLTSLESKQAFVVWIALSLASYVASITMICRSLSLSVWSIALLCALTYASPAMFTTLLSGQVALLLLLPCTLAWRSARHARDIAFGAWLGVCASLKPPLLFFAPALAVARRPRAALVLAVVVAVLFACGLALFGVEAHREWIRNLASVTWTEHYLNASVLGLLERSLSVSEWPQRPVANAHGLIGPLWIVIGCGMAIVTLDRVRRLANVDEQLLLVTAAALLLSPISWVYYTWLLVPSLAGTLTQPVRAPARAALLAASIAGLLVPPILPSMAIRWSGVATLSVGSIYCWALLALWLFAASGARVSAQRAVG